MSAIRKPIGYVRVSSSNHQENDVSLDAQQQIIYNYCIKKLLKLPIMISEIISGHKNDTLIKFIMINNVKESDIIIYDVSRFGRNFDRVKDTLLKIISKCNRIHFIKEEIIIDMYNYLINNSEWTKFINSLKNVELESQKISEEIKLLKQYQKRTGLNNVSKIMNQSLKKFLEESK